MKIVTTPNELMDRGAWIAACELLGFNEWAVNEGLMDSDHEITLTDQQAFRLGFIPRPEDEDEEASWESSAVDPEFRAEMAEIEAAYDGPEGGRRRL